MICIWYISKYVTLPNQGNAGSRGYLIMRQFARIGHKCIIITSDSNHLAKPPILENPYFRQDIDSLQVWWVKTFKYNLAKSVKRVISWLNFEWRLWLMPKSDLPKPNAVIISSLSLLTIINGFLLRRRYGCKLILEIRDIWPLTIIEEGGFSTWNPLILFLKWIEKISYQYADVIVGTMPNLSEHIHRVLGEKKTAYCIPMGIDSNELDITSSLSSDYIRKYIPKDKFIVVHAGTIGITNALETLLQCALLMQNNPFIHFLLVGNGSLLSYYKKKYNHLTNVTFAPKIEKKMIQSLLFKCDLLYFSTHISKVWRYGQSLNKVVDYMLSGKPIVASYTGYPSMINEAGCGTFVPANNSNELKIEIERYFNMTDNQRIHIGTKGRDWIINNRNYKKLANEYLLIINGN